MTELASARLSGKNKIKHCKHAFTYGHVRLLFPLLFPGEAQTARRIWSHDHAFALHSRRRDIQSHGKYNVGLSHVHRKIIQIDVLVCSSDHVISIVSSNNRHPVWTVPPSSGSTSSTLRWCAAGLFAIVCFKCGNPFSASNRKANLEKRRGLRGEIPSPPF